jgi:hypothetical protein
MNGYRKYLPAPPPVAIVILAANWNTMLDDDQQPVRELDKHTRQNLTEGKQLFRLDRFDDDSFWGDTLGPLQGIEGIEGTRFGSVGGGLSPKTALAVGLKVDVYALSASLVSALKQGRGQSRRFGRDTGTAAPQRGRRFLLRWALFCGSAA